MKEYVSLLDLSHQRERCCFVCLIKRSLIFLVIYSDSPVLWVVYVTKAERNIKIFFITKLEGTVRVL